MADTCFANVLNQCVDMSTLTNMQEAKSHLSDLIDRAMHGEEVIIARDGIPCVRLVPVSTAAQSRIGGEFRGRIRGDVLGSVDQHRGGRWG